MGANAGSAGDVDSFAQLLELALFSLPFSTSPLPSDHQQGAVDFQGANACGLLPNSQTRIEPTFALLSLATIDFPAPNFLVLR